MFFIKFADVQTTETAAEKLKVNFLFFLFDRWLLVMHISISIK